MWIRLASLAQLRWNVFWQDQYLSTLWGRGRGELKRASPGLLEKEYNRLDVYNWQVSILQNFQILGMTFLTLLVAGLYIIVYVGLEYRLGRCVCFWGNWSKSCWYQKKMASCLGVTSQTHKKQVLLGDVNRAMTYCIVLLAPSGALIAIPTY